MPLRPEIPLFFMRRTIFIFSVMLFATSFSACVLLSPQKYKALLAAQDSLNSGWSADQLRLDEAVKMTNRLRSDTAELHAKIRKLNASFDDMSVNYNKLRTNSSSEISKLSEDLKAREQRLKEVEDILSKRDAASKLLKDKLEQALLGFSKNGLTVELRNGKVYVSLTDKLLFPTASIVIDEKGKQALSQLATVLRQQPEINIAVEGHTDSQKVNNLGQIKDNWDLSVLRSTSVVRFLTESEGVEGVRMTATGRGEFQPLAPNLNAEDRSKNRRIEIVLSPKLDELYNLIKK